MKTKKNREEVSDNQEFVGDMPNFEADGRFEGDGAATDNLSDNAAAGAVNPAEAEEVDWKDRYARLSAEFDNFRKRTAKEKLELIILGGEDVIASILSVLDDFERAIEAMDKSDDIESARQGMHLIHKKLIDTLKQKGLTEIEADGADFDTDLHEAITKFPSENKKGKVIDTVQKGYKLKDKVIRYCKVVVGE